MVQKYQRKKFSSMFGVNSNGQSRIIKFEKPYVEFMWLDAATKEEKKRFLVSDILDIVEGKKSDNFERFEHARKELCFSILMSTRTIDLECANERDYLKLLSGFKFIQSLYQKFSRNLFILECMDDPTFGPEVFELN